MKNKRSSIHWEFVVVFLMALLLFLLVLIFLLPGSAEGYDNFLKYLRNLI